MGILLASNTSRIVSLHVTADSQSLGSLDISVKDNSVIAVSAGIYYVCTDYMSRYYDSATDVCFVYGLTQLLTASALY